jgi:hypothetical protein
LEKVDRIPFEWIDHSGFARRPGEPGAILLENFRIAREN